ncbi:hypothetical protein [Geovibrio ferrireducens]|uniref:hypothetical protein n=1 Tax=Geovibrio ferrireducens TaxID=46201 RepID=UPI0022458EF4|nr:hypothetical protein [Geovibrio ferrireducens]
MGLSENKPFYNVNNKTLELECDTYWVEICMAGDIDHAQQFYRRKALEFPECLTFTKTKYMYFMGEEEGFFIRRICYPRFKRSKEQIFSRMFDFAFRLMIELNQGSFSLIDHEKTHTYSWRPDHRPAVYAEDGE